MDLNGKHILVISPEPWEGLQLSKHDLARALVEKGNSVVFWGPPQRGAFRTRIKRDGGIGVVRYRHWLRGANRLGRAVHTSYYRRFIARLEELTGRRFDIIWCFDISRLQWFPEHPALKVLHLADHDILFDHPGTGLIRTADLVLTVTGQLRAAVKELVPDANVEHIGHMVSDHWLHGADPSPTNDRVRTVALAGNLITPYIDWEVLNTIVSQHPELEFVFYGPYDLDYPVPLLRETLTLPNVRLKGMVDRNTLIPALRAADLLLVCYNAERLGPVVANSHKLLEYLATGHPIVSSWTEEYAAQTDLLRMSRARWDLPEVFTRTVKGFVEESAPDRQRARQALATARTASSTLDRLAGLMSAIVSPIGTSVAASDGTPARKRKKILFVSSDVVDSKEYEGMVENWDRERFEVEFIFLNKLPDSKTQRVIRARGYRSSTYIHRGRRHLLPNLLRLMFRLWRTRPDVVQGNLLEGSMLALLAGRITGVGRLVYARHHTTHNHKYFPRRGVFYDRMINAMAHRIIAISANVREVLTTLEKVPDQKVVTIRHGFDLDVPPAADPVRAERLRRKYDIGAEIPYPLIGVIARPFAWKGLDHAIPAFADLLRKWPNARLMIFHWKHGGHAARYEAMLDRLPLKSWRTVHWETDLDQFFHEFDVLVHVPEDALSEPFGYVYVEGLVNGTPSVFTRSGILRELDGDRLKGISVVPFQDPKAITAAIERVIDAAPDPDRRRENAVQNTGYLREEIGMERRMDHLWKFYGSL